MKCLKNEMSVYEMSVYEMSQHQHKLRDIKLQFYESIFLWVLWYNRWVWVEDTSAAHKTRRFAPKASHVLTVHGRTKGPVELCVAEIEFEDTTAEFELEDTTAEFELEDTTAEFELEQPISCIKTGFFVLHLPSVD